MHMYVLLLIALNSWHLCFNRVYFAESRRATYFYQILYYQVLYRTDFSSWHQRVVYVCQEIFSPRPPRGGRVRSCLRVLDGGAINLYVRCVGASAAFCAVYVVLFVGTSSRAFLPRFPLRPFPRYSVVVLCARARGSVRYVVGRLFVCLRMQTFLTGLFHDVFMFNIDG